MDILLAAWFILTESAVYILLGFLIAGLLEAGFSGRGLHKLLSGRTRASVIWAGLFGVPLPLCSCSVLPTALSLRRQGAGKGAVLSFLISTPETSVTSILLSYSLLGPLWAVFRPVAAAVTALSAGFLELAFGARDEAIDGEADPAVAGEGGAPVPCKHDHSGVHSHADDHEHFSILTAADSADEPVSAAARLRRSMRYAFVDLFDDIFAWILLGVLAAGLLQVLVPAESMQLLLGGPLQSMIVMILIGVPLYVCAEASTPIAAILLTQGVNPGAVLVFLLVGPGTNIGSLGALSRVLGRRTIAIYLLSIVVTAVLMGVVLNAIVASSAVPLSARVLGEPLLPAWLKNAGAVVFLLLGTESVFRADWMGRLAAFLRRRTGMPFNSTGATGLTALVLLSCYAFQGVVLINADEVGIKQRFGAMHGGVLEPGLHFCWPYPVDSVTKVNVTRVRRTVVGSGKSQSEDDDRGSPALYAASRAAASTGQPNTLRTDGKTPPDWNLLGDENIADVEVVAHWSVDRQALDRFVFDTVDPDVLVADAVQSAARMEFASATITSALTSQRKTLESAIEKAASGLISSYGCGIRLVRVKIVDAHAPVAVHGSFRDVAGALEDRAARINQARAERARLIPRAQGEASQRLADAAGYAARAVHAASGEVVSFLSMLEGRAADAAVTDMRLEFEMLESVLPSLRKYIRPADGEAGSVEIWVVDGARTLEGSEAWP